MLKALLKTRLQALASSFFRRTSNKKERSTLAKIGICVLALYVVGCLFMMFAMLYSSILEPFHDSGLSWLYFAIAFMLASMLCLVGSVFMAQSLLFAAKDNDLLLSMPIKPSAIVLSRMSSLMVLSYGYELIVVLPAAFIWVTRYAVSVPGALCFIIVALLLPFLPMTLSCLLGYVIAFISSKLRNKNIVTLVFSLAFLAAYLFFYSRIGDYVAILVANGATVGDTIKTAMPPFYHMGVAVASHGALDLLLTALWCLVPFALVYAAVSRTFIGIATAERGMKQVKYREKSVDALPVPRALVQREIRRFLSSSMYMLNAGLGLVFMVIIAGLLVFNPGALTEIFAIGLITKESMAPVAAAALTLSASMVMISAPSVSLEGKNITIIQSLPVKCSDVLIAKARCHILFSIPFVLVSAALVDIAFAPPFLAAAAVFLCPLAASILFGYLGVVVNLYFPKLDWTNEVVAVKQGISTIISMMVSLFLAVAPLILYISVDAISIDVSLYAFAFAGLYLLLALLLKSHLIRRGARRFEFLA